MQIVSYNVNGIRSAMSKGLLNWMEQRKADIYCFQETKASREQVDHSVRRRHGPILGGGTRWSAGGAPAPHDCSDPTRGQSHVLVFPDAEDDPVVRPEY